MIEKYRIFKEELSWEQNGERIAKSLGIPNIKEFNNWFCERERLGYHIDHRMIGRCFHIWTELENDLDHLAILSGREGTGKTTLSTHLASWVTPVMEGKKTMVYDLEQYLKQLKDRADNYQNDSKYLSIIVDEGGLDMFSRDAQNIKNKIMSKSLFVQRFLRCFVLVNIPNFHMLDSTIRNHRVRTLIEIKEKGEYKCIVGTGIKIVSENGFKQKDVMNVKVPQQYFWEGWWHKGFSVDFDQTEYERNKLKNIRGFINRSIKDLHNSEIKQEMAQEDFISSKYVPAAKIAELTGMATHSVCRMVQMGRARGRKIGGRWYVEKAWFDEFIVPKNINTSNTIEK